MLPSSCCSGHPGPALGLLRGEACCSVTYRWPTATDRSAQGAGHREGPKKYSLKNVNGRQSEKAIPGWEDCKSCI